MAAQEIKVKDFETIELQKKPGSLFLKSLKFLAIALLVLGIILRFANLDLRPYWYDETYTSLQISGYNDSEVRQQINGQVIPPTALQRYQYPSPEKSVVNTVQHIAQKEPQLSPLYFILTRFWVQALGNSVVVTRSLSAVFSLLTLLGMYWLCRELFKSKSIAWMAVALVAVSPFHVLYAQEARPPALWALTIVLSHLALLRAVRRQTFIGWVLYALSGAIALYTFFFSFLVLIGHGVYLLVKEQFRITQSLIAFTCSFAVAAISFSPWLLVFLPNTNQANHGNNPAIFSAPVFYATRWVRNLGLLFADFNVGEESSKLVLIPFLVTLLVVTGVVLYAIYSIYRTAPKSVSLFVCTAIIVPFVPLVLKDLVSGGGVSTVGRYLIPSLLGIHLAVAHLFANQFDSATLQLRGRTFWRGVMSAVLLLGVLSCLLMVKSELWWNKAEANLDRQLANQVINQANNPLLISDAYFAFALSLSHSLNPTVKLLLVPENSVPTLPTQAQGKVFVYRPSPTLLKGLQQRYSLEPVTIQDAYTPGKGGEGSRLWQLTPKPGG
ncbi:MAG: glycosyltransferase family 39 protein [Leptolyngbyaceae cyanobacterium bins.349]|nr:glycosyltransferase family 39 protein [Leptolyngbyaceae cyanobacterium bins.349]